MRSCIVLGSGRSGTSMVTGALAEAGYHMGGTPHGARSANPRGFFETPEVNGVNEALLAPVLPPHRPLAEGQRWLGVLPPGAEIPAPPHVARRLELLTSRPPFCFKDPRFCYTLPAWRPHLDDCVFVCVFRHPLLTARSMVEEVQTAHYLRDVHLDMQGALDIWRAMYTHVVRTHQREGSWLFLHYEQALLPEGLERLGRHTGAEVDGGFPDRGLFRPHPEGALPPETAGIYAELVSLAGYEPTKVSPRPKPGARSRRQRSQQPIDVSVVVLARRGEEARLGVLLDQVRGQRGLTAELVAVDRGLDGGLEIPGARVVHEPSPSTARAIQRGAAAGDGRLVALQDLHAGLLPGRLRRQIAALEQNAADVVTCDLQLLDRWDQFKGRVDPGHGDAPFWTSTVLARREALSEMPLTAFFPAPLAWLRRLQDEGRRVHVDEGLVTVPEGLYRAATGRARADARLVDLSGESSPGAPRLTVSLCTFQRRDVLLECLEAFCRQELPPGTFEIVLVDDGSTDGTAELLEGLDWPLPVTMVRQENSGLAAARNTGLDHSRGDLVLFVNDDTIPCPDMVAGHIHAHESSGDRVAVLGTFKQPPDALDNALMAWLERSTEVFSYARLEAGRRLDGRFFWTCNVSVPSAAVREAGGFDTSFRHYGCEDTDLGVRLERLGFQVVYHPEIEALHRHLLTLADLERRQRTVARAYVRFFIKHPSILSRWQGTGAVTIRSCENLIERSREASAAAMRAAAELAPMDLRGMRASGSHPEAVAEQAVEALGEQVRVLNQTWWHEGYLEGFKEHGISGFPEVLARSPIQLGAIPGPRTLLVPDPGSPQWRVALEAWLAEPPAGTLILRAHPSYGYNLEELLLEVAGPLARARRAGRDPGVVVAEIPLAASLEARLLAAVDHWIPVPGPHVGRHRRIAGELGVEGHELPEVDLALPSASKPLRAMAWPEWGDQAALDHLLGTVARPLAGHPLACLCLGTPPEEDLSTHEVVEKIERAYQRAYGGDGATLDVVLVDCPSEGGHIQRLTAEVDVVISPDRRSQLHPALASMVIPVVETADQVGGWLTDIERVTAEVPRIQVKPTD